MDSATGIGWPGARGPDRNEEACGDHPQKAYSGWSGRVAALVALTGVVSGLGFVVHSAYRAISDSYVAPMKLSPDSDIVVANTVKITQLEIEKSRATSELEVAEAELEAVELETAKLTELKEQVAHGSPWERFVNSLEAKAGAVATDQLAKASAMLAGMLARQEEAVSRARANLDAGVISRDELKQEEQSLDRLKLALVENERSRTQTALSFSKTRLAERSLAGQGGAPTMPQILLARELSARVEIELVQIAARGRAKRAEKKALSATLEKISALETQLKSRPLFRAVEKNLDAAFVPYSQIENVSKGAKVYQCVLGLFACKPVGFVAELVPGEVVLPDPWGKPARGQYAVLDLFEHESARAMILRVRNPRTDRLGASTSDEGLKDGDHRVSMK